MLTLLLVLGAVTCSPVPSDLSALSDAAHIEVTHEVRHVTYEVSEEVNEATASSHIPSDVPPEEDPPIPTVTTPHTTPDEHHPQDDSTEEHVAPSQPEDPAGEISQEASAEHEGTVEESIHEGTVEESLHEDTVEESLHEDTVEESLHEGTVEESLHEGTVEESLHEGTVEESLHEGTVEESLHEGTVEESLHEGTVEESLHEGTVEESLHEGTVEESLHEGTVEESFHEDTVDESLHEGTVEESLHEVAVEETLHEETKNEEEVIEVEPEEQNDTPVEVEATETENINESEQSQGMIEDSSFESVELVPESHTFVPSDDENVSQQEDTALEESDVSGITSGSEEVIAPATPTDVVDSPVALTEVIDSQAAPTEAVDSQVAPTEVVDSQAAPTEILDLQAAPTEIVDLQAAPTEIVELQAAPTKGAELPAVPTEGADTPAEVIDTAATPTEVVDTPAAPAEVVDTTDETKELIGVEQSESEESISPVETEPASKEMIQEDAQEPTDITAQMNDPVIESDSHIFEGEILEEVPSQISHEDANSEFLETEKRTDDEDLPVHDALAQEPVSESSDEVAGVAAPEDIVPETTRESRVYVEYEDEEPESENVEEEPVVPEQAKSHSESELKPANSGLESMSMTSPTPESLPEEVPIVDDLEKEEAPPAEDQEEETVTVIPEIDSQEENSTLITDVEEPDIVPEVVISPPSSSIAPLPSEEFTDNYSDQLESGGDLPDFDVTHEQLPSKDHPLPQEAQFIPEQTHDHTGEVSEGESSDLAAGDHMLEVEAGTPRVLPPQQEQVSAAAPSALTPGCIVAIVFGVLISLVVILGVGGFMVWQRRTQNRPKVLGSDQGYAGSDSGGYIDDQVRVSYVNSQTDTPKGSPEDLISLDNDSFLNSLESMTIQNLWTDNIRHTKL